MKRYALGNRVTRPIWILAVSGISLSVTGPLLSESTSTDEDVYIAGLVEQVFRGALHQEEIDIDGQKVVVRVQPSESELRELRHQGERAVSFIAAHLRSNAMDERILAVGLLANQGGPQIIEPLQFALRDPVSRVRLAAVNSLSAAPGDLAVRLLEEAADHDSDEEVREAAKKLLEQSRKAASAHD